MRDSKKINNFEIREQKAKHLIEQSIELVNNKINTEKDLITIDCLKKILIELNKMKEFLSPYKYMPTYGYIIVDSWQDFDEIGEKLLETANYYKEKLK